jgi:NADH-quinone oxidoreductase subunit G
VGALTSTDFRFKMRVWFLKQTNSIDTESSVGANTVVWSREGSIYRITPRRNDEVNDTWMADSGRLLYKEAAAPGRLAQTTIAGQAAPAAAALAKAAELFRAGGIAVVGSGRSSVEEQFLAKKLAAALQAPVWLVGRVGRGDGILISADRNPNVRGALVTGLISALPEAALGDLAARIEDGRVRTVVSLGEDLIAAGLTPSQLEKAKVIYLGARENATSAAAAVVFPGLTVFEKGGTFINQQFRIQKFAAAVPGPTGAAADLDWLSQMVIAAGGPGPAGDLGAVWTALAAEAPGLAALDYASLPETGILLDATPWAGLPFAEGATLHHQPTL